MSNGRICLRISVNGQRLRDYWLEAESLNFVETGHVACGDGGTMSLMIPVELRTADGVNITPKEFEGGVGWMHPFDLHKDPVYSQAYKQGYDDGYKDGFEDREG